VSPSTRSENAGRRGGDDADDDELACAELDNTVERDVKWAVCDR
jgi:hypothetical protein